MREPTENLENLFEIFNCSSKRELKKYTQNIVIYQQDLVTLIYAVQQGALAPYVYANHFSRKVPDHLNPKDTEHEAIANNGIGKFKTKKAEKFTKKIFQIPIEMRSQAAHLFYTPDWKYWNLFYFDNRDRDEYKNHWKHGTHIHFISDLWSNLSLEDVWKKVHSGKLSFSSKLHLRYVPD